MKKSNYLFRFSNGTFESVSCTRDELDSIVLNRLDSCHTLDHRITHISVFQYVGSFYHFVLRYYVQGLIACGAL